MQILKRLVHLSMYFLFQPTFTISHILRKFGRHALPHRIIIIILGRQYNDYAQGVGKLQQNHSLIVRTINQLRSQLIRKKVNHYS